MGNVLSCINTSACSTTRFNNFEIMVGCNMILLAGGVFLLNDHGDEE
jgi:hypothetical protein